jgi:prephenate dehydrogenase
MKVYIVGIGLIGGSMALDIKSIYDDAVVSEITTKSILMKQ